MQHNLDALPYVQVYIILKSGQSFPKAKRTKPDCSLPTALEIILIFLESEVDSHPDAGSSYIDIRMIEVVRQMGQYAPVECNSTTVTWVSSCQMNEEGRDCNDYFLRNAEGLVCLTARFSAGELDGPWAESFRDYIQKLVLPHLFEEIVNHLGCVVAAGKVA
jgi:hypothetical protein